MDSKREEMVIKVHYAHKFLQCLNRGWVGKFRYYLNLRRQQDSTFDEMQ